MVTNIKSHLGTTNPTILLKYSGSIDDQVQHNLITSTLNNFQKAFCGSQGCSVPNKIYVHSFSTKSDYDAYLKENDSNYIKKAKHFTILDNENEFEICVHLDRSNIDWVYSSLKRGIAHALIESNKKWGTVLPTPIKVGMADYVAGLDENYRINNKSDDNRDFNTIREKGLTLSTILTKENGYGSLAEQVIKFLELKHAEDFDQLLQDLNGVDIRKEGREKVNEFIENSQNYNNEFSKWIDQQPIQNDDPVIMPGFFDDILG